MGACKVKKYVRREPEKTVLYQAVQDHFESFLAARSYEGRDLPAYIIKEFREFLKCGRLDHGLVIVHCADCKHHYPVGLSCKRRGFCCSCGGKRMNETAMHLIDNVLPHAPYRQYVVTLPPALRYWVGTSRKLARAVHRIAVSEIDRYYKAKAVEMYGVLGEPGAISFTQLAGSAINYNYHWHILYLDGVYVDDGGVKLKRLKSLTNADVEKILGRVVARVIKLCRRKGLLSEEGEALVQVKQDSLFEDHDILAEVMDASIRQKIALGERKGQEVRKIGKSFGFEGEIAVPQGHLCYSQNGFSIHAATVVHENDRKKLEQLIRYISRPPVANHRLKKQPDGTYTYKLKTPWNNGQITHVKFSGEELIEKLMAIIPTPRAHMSKHCGVFSSHHYLREQIILRPEIKKGFFLDDKTDKPKRVTRSVLFMRTFKIDLTRCPACGGENVRVTKAIFDSESITRYLQDYLPGYDPPQKLPTQDLAKLLPLEPTYEPCHN